MATTARRPCLFYDIASFFLVLVSDNFKLDEFLRVLGYVQIRHIFFPKFLLW